MITRRRKHDIPVVRPSATAPGVALPPVSVQSPPRFGRRDSGKRVAPEWQQSLARAVTDPVELLEMLDLGRDWLPAARAAAKLFPLRVPLGFIARMSQGNPNDPLLRQVLPLGLECDEAAGYGPDPVGDLESMAIPGLLHKYQGRALLTVTGACAIHCRYCFRRHFPYARANPSTAHWAGVVDYLSHDPSIREVILSGGDPLTLSDHKLAELSQAIAKISHVERIRIHTRLPIVLPERVDEGLLSWLGSTRLQWVVVVHVNHPQEMDNTVIHALTRLRQSGATLLNQSVLLKGVNDRVEILADLSERLFRAGVLPYYLHMLDKVQGASHFEVPQAVAQELISALSARLPGYLVPRLVREIPGAPGKQQLAPVSIETNGSG